MGVFEILFIALFILFPILEQVLKKRNAPGPKEPGPDAMETRPGEVERPSSEREPVEAADMVPDDLWAVLTGEQRPTGGMEAEGGSAEGAAWTEAEGATADPEPAPVSDAPYERVDEPWSSTDAGYSGSEADALEPLDVDEAVSLERPIVPSEVRHRRFHETVDRKPPPRKRRRSALGRALSTPENLRQAFVLSEVLGTPKGLE